MPRPIPPEDALLRLDVPVVEGVWVAAVLQADLDRYGVEPAVWGAEKSACSATALSFG